MTIRLKIGISVGVCIIILFLAVGLGSVFIRPDDIIAILLHKFFGINLDANIDSNTVSILWKIRLPRALLAFVVGSALAVSGTVMQSVLKNPLASSYTLGVSSGASLGVGIVMVMGISIPILGIFTMPFLGLLGGLLTVFLAVTFTAKIDRNMENNTIILVGMVVSLFINAFLTVMSAMTRESMQRMMLWQMGSFSLKSWSHVLMLIPIVFIGILYILRFSRELDIMTFGEDQAKVMGIDIKRVKWILLFGSAALTGCAISLVGVIGFIDLIAPHVVRKIFGSAHKYVIPMSALFGGAFMMVADLVARTILSPSELPVGAITAIIGAPFFAYVYFSKRKVV